MANKILCNFRFSEDRISKLKRLAILRKCSMTDILESCIDKLRERPKNKYD